MSFYLIAKKMMAACVVSKGLKHSIVNVPKTWAITAFLSLIMLHGLILTCAANAAVNIYAPNVQLQNQFINDTTTQWNGIVTAGVFSGSYNVNLTSRKATVIPVDPKIATLDSITNKVVAISTNSAVDFYAMGMEYERSNDAGMAGNAVANCGNPAYFNTVAIDSTTCNIVAGYISNWITFQTSGVVVVPDIIQ